MKTILISKEFSELYRNYLKKVLGVIKMFCCILLYGFFTILVAALVFFPTDVF